MTEPAQGTGGTGRITRREGLALVLMGVGLALSYGALALQGLAFLLPT
jgi:hypothetical protein